MLELSKGTQLAERYTLERPLGRGGEAATWLARDRLTRASVALKIVAASHDAGARLRQEWQTNLRLMHAHIVRAFEFHEDQGLAFYSLQFIDGADLGALTAEPLAEILAPAGLIADALRYAHAKGIVHRDVKASNVLLDHNGAPYLSDFGVAAEIGAPAGGGSPVAASPQSLQGEPAQPADDIYALGVLLHELIAGAPPDAAAPLLQRTASGEVVPEPVATAISARTSMVMISMGSGPNCDAQYLFSTDILGTNRGHVPRHAKQYSDLAAEEDRLQRMRVEAFAAYKADVDSGAFPDDPRLVPIPDNELSAFMDALEEEMA